MSTKTEISILGTTLFGKTRRAVLALLYSHPDESFYLRQIARMTGAGMGALQRELKQLSEAGIIQRSEIGQQAFFMANADCPVFHELRNSGEFKQSSDLDVMVIGKIEFAEIVVALTPVQETLAREINPSVYPPEEFRSKLAGGHHFLKTVSSAPKIFLIGNENELEELAQRKNHYLEMP
jgi:hypothetical protein